MPPRCLAFIHGNAKEAFDWERRAFFLEFGEADPAVRERAFRALCAECGVDPARYLVVGRRSRGAPAGRHDQEAAQGIAGAVRAWLDGLDDAQRAKATSRSRRRSGSSGRTRPGLRDADSRSARCARISGRRRGRSSPRR